MSLQFLLTSLLIVAAPGTGAIYCIFTGMKSGIRSSLIAALACTLGILPHLLAAITGLAALLHASAVAFHSIKYAGVLYLFYLAWNMWKDEGEAESGEMAPTQSMSSILRKGIVINLLNPKLTIFFFAFLPGFVDSGSASGSIQMLYLSGIFMALTFIVFAIYGAMAGWFQSVLLTNSTSMRILNKIFAVSFVAVGSRLAFEKQ